MDSSIILNLLIVRCVVVLVEKDELLTLYLFQSMPQVFSNAQHNFPQATDALRG